MNQDIEQVIVRYLSGESNEDDIMLLSEWFSSNDTNKKTFLNIKSYWEAEVTGVKVPCKEQSIDRLLSRVRKTDKKTLISRPWFQYLNIAVAAILVGVCFYLYIFKTSYVPDEEQYYSYVSGNGISSFSLPDGSQITLNKSSELIFSNRYNMKERKIKLIGEAYFDVAHNEDVPFTVELDGGTSVTVFGTIFNIRNRPEENTAKAFLLEGSIRFNSPVNSLFLLPDQQLSYNKENEKIDIETVDAEITTSWIKSLIKYKSVSFQDFLSLLEENYNVTFTIEKEMFGGEKLSGTFDAHVPLEKILNLMKKNVDFDWIKQQDNQYKIVRNNKK